MFQIKNSRVKWWHEGGTFYQQLQQRESNCMESQLGFSFALWYFSECCVNLRFLRRWVGSHRAASQAITETPTVFKQILRGFCSGIWKVSKWASGKLERLQLLTDFYLVSLLPKTQICQPFLSLQVSLNTNVIIQICSFHQFCPLQNEGVNESTSGQ